MNDKLLKIVRKLSESYKLHTIILFGSRARGDFGPWSDYDFLIIGDFKSPYLKRIGDVLETLSEVKIPVEPHPYTLEEAEKC